MSDSEKPFSKLVPFVKTLDPWDRRYEKDVTPASGLTLRQAMLFYAQEALADDFLELEDRFGGDPPMLFGLDGYPVDRSIILEFDSGGHRLRMIGRRLENQLHEKLTDGRLLAKGLVPEQPLHAGLQNISRDRWRLLTMNLIESSASGGGMTIHGILVFEPRSTSATASSDSAPMRQYSEAKAREWYVGRVANLVASGSMSTREQDEQAAREAFDGGVSRNLLRSLRSEHAPQEWQSRGRRKAPGS